MASAVSPTPRQMTLLRFIRGFQLAHGFSPCLREMAVGLGYSPKQKGHVFRMLAGLEERGLIRRPARRTRSIELLVAPTIATAPDGAPLYSVAIPELAL